MPTIFTLISDNKHRHAVAARAFMSPAQSGVPAEAAGSYISTAGKTKPEGTARPDVLVGTVLGSVSGLVISAWPGLADTGAFASAGPLAPFILGGGIGLMAGGISSWFRG
jgi:hypothetical protein